MSRPTTNKSETATSLLIDLDNEELRTRNARSLTDSIAPYNASSALQQQKKNKLVRKCGARDGFDSVSRTAEEFDKLLPFFDKTETGSA